MTYLEVPPPAALGRDTDASWRGGQGPCCLATHCAAQLPGSCRPSCLPPAAAGRGTGSALLPTTPHV